MKRQRGKASSSASASAGTITAEDSYNFISTLTRPSSPVPGVENELALLLIRAIKARRKLLSSSSKRHANIRSSSNTTTNNDDDDGDAENAANDATTTFLNALKLHAQTRHDKNSNTPSRCLQFLLDITSDPTNSIHLRRSSLYMAAQILVKSSNARHYFAKDHSSHLLNFIGMIERMAGEVMTAAVEAAGAVAGENHDETEEEKEDETSRRFDRQYYHSSPQAKMQLEAVELIYTLANQFGIFYPQYTVASRLLGDISLHFSPPPSSSMMTQIYNHNNRGNAAMRMRVMRTHRDEALTLGPTRCCQFERMVDRADNYFRILMPRYGGFNYSDTMGAMRSTGYEGKENDTTSEEKTIGQGSSSPNQFMNGSGVDTDVVDEDNDDDISIEWEEGDIESFENVDDNTSRTKVADHEVAVSHTLDVMTRSGALLDGQLTIQVGRDTSSSTHPAVEPCVDLSTTTTEDATDPIARRRLHNLVRKISSRHLPRLYQWIHALSHADMMQERAVIDPIAATMPGTGGRSGPVSLILLPQEKRAMRGLMLHRMMRIREDLVGVLRSSESLGITANKRTRAVEGGDGSNEVPPHDASNYVTMKHPMPPTMPSRIERMVAHNVNRNKIISSKTSSRVRVVYRKR